MAEFIFSTIPAQIPCEPCNAKVGDVWVIGGEKHEQIVRCRDCEQGIETERNGKAIIDCHGPLVQTWDHYNDEPLVNPVPPDGFCKWGIRREDA